MMTHPGTGLVLPESTLTSTWFLVLLTMVAFNTIVYLGLTLSKVVVMPRQLRASQLRRWMRKLGMDPDKDTATDDIPRPEPSDSPDPYENMRRGIVRRDIPRAFGFAGALIIFITTIALVTSASSRLPLQVVELSVGVLFLICAQVLNVRPFRATTVIWTWTVACVLLVCLLLGQVIYTNSEFPIAYAFIVMTAFAPINMSWLPSIAGAALMLTALIAASQHIQNGDDIGLITAGILALLISGTLLRLRLTSITALTDEKVGSDALATTDVLTGVLTPRGLLTVTATVAGSAERTNQDVCVMHFCVEDMAMANEQYGVHYGDDVLRAVAKAIRGTVRMGDLIARWEGDQFVVVGIDGRPNADKLASRIQGTIFKGGVNLGRWPTNVTVGTAAGDPRRTTFDQLLLTAKTSRSPATPSA